MTKAELRTKLAADVAAYAKAGQTIKTLKPGKANGIPKEGSLAFFGYKNSISNKGRVAAKYKFGDALV